MHRRSEATAAADAPSVQIVSKIASKELASKYCDLSSPLRTSLKRQQKQEIVFPAPFCLYFAAFRFRSKQAALWLDDYDRRHRRAGRSKRTAAESPGDSRRMLLRPRLLKKAGTKRRWSPPWSIRDKVRALGCIPRRVAAVPPVQLSKEIVV